jgi:hypothetical protein
MGERRGLGHVARAAAPDFLPARPGEQAGRDGQEHTFDLGRRGEVLQTQAARLVQGPKRAAAAAPYIAPIGRAPIGWRTRFQPIRALNQEFLFHDGNYSIRILDNDILWEK